jgi:Ca2+-dependent lipid-binding protein
LPVADSDGSADPYVELYNPDGKHLKTKVVDDNLNPIFYEVKDLMFDCISLKDAPPLVFSVYDTDASLLDSSDDFLGRSVIYLTDIHPDPEQLIAYGNKANTPPLPKWYDMRPSFDKNATK